MGVDWVIQIHLTSFFVILSKYQNYHFLHFYVKQNFIILSKQQRQEPEISKTVSEILCSALGLNCLINKQTEKITAKCFYKSRPAT